MTLSFDDIDIALEIVGPASGCAWTVRAMPRVHVFEGEHGPACHPEQINALVEAVLGLGLCTLSQLSPGAVDITSP